MGVIVTENEDRATVEGLDLLVRLVNNIISKPSETKYRTIKTTIHKIQSTIWSLKGGIRYLLIAFGFQQVDDDHYVFVGEYFEVMKKGVKLTEEVLEPVRVKLMGPEERRRWEVQ